MHVHVHVHAYAYVYVYVYHLSTHACKPLCTCAYMPLCMCMHVIVHAHAYQTVEAGPVCVHVRMPIRPWGWAASSTARRGALAAAPGVCMCMYVYA